MGRDLSNSEDLYTKIALDNKLITRFQVRKACEEQEGLSEGGTQLELGLVMVRLGFLSERQHQSVLNACRYREQRDYDKRFGRQLLRMELSSQDTIEAALEIQKNGYTKSGTVKPLAEVMVEEGDLSEAQAENVHKGIQERDRARQQAKKDRSGRVAQLKISGTTPLVRREASGEEVDELDGDSESGLGDADLESALGNADLEDADLEDADLEDADDEDLDDEDLDDEDLDDEDLDDEDLDDEDLDDEDLEDADLDDADLDDDDLDDDDDDAGGAAKLDDVDLDDIDIDDIDLDDIDDEEDEADLAQTASELDSEVQLDEEDLRALDEMESGEQVTGEVGWAADAFDDRPIHERPPSDRQKIEPPLPRRTPPPSRPAKPPVVPHASSGRSAKASSRAPKTSAKRQGETRGDIPGGDVFEPNISGMGSISDVEQVSDIGRLLDEDGGLDADLEAALGSADGPTSDSDAIREDPLEASARGLEEHLLDEESNEVQPTAPARAKDSPSEERRIQIKSAVTGAVQRALKESARTKPPEEAPAAPPKAPGRDVIEPEGVRHDPRVQRAFQKAMQTAWEVFVEELERGED